MAEEDAAEKSHDPSQKRLSDARRKGDLPRSSDLNTAAGYAGLLLVAHAFGTHLVEGLGTALTSLVERPHLLAEALFSGADTATSGHILAAVLLPVAPVLLVPATTVLVSLIAQQALVFAPEKLALKLSRISPIEGAKSKFGRNGLFEFAKSFIKLCAFSAILFLVLRRQFPEMLIAVSGTPGQITLRLTDLCLGFLAVVLAIAATIGALDFLWQRAEHLRRNRMSLKEMRDEHKDSEGDPHMRQQRRQRGMEIAANRMLAAVKEADVVVVNPTHYAVALKWDRSRLGAPTCVAKGVDEIAARIRERAAEAGIPLRRDPPTARAIFETVELGAEIRPEHYAAIAAAIRFADAMRRKARML